MEPLYFRTRVSPNQSFLVPWRRSVNPGGREWRGGKWVARTVVTETQRFLRRCCMRSWREPHHPVYKNNHSVQDGTTQIVCVDEDASSSESQSHRGLVCKRHTQMRDCSEERHELMHGFSKFIAKSMA